MEEDTKRSLYVSWGIGLLMVATAWAFGGPYWIGATAVLGTLLVLRGHFPNLFRLGRHAASSDLVFDGCGNMQRSFAAPFALQNLFIIGVKNSLISVPRDLHNIKARIEYYYDGKLEFVTSPARWQESPAKKRVVLNALTVDLEPGETENLSIFMEGADHVTFPLQPQFPQTAFDEHWRTRDLKKGRWLCRILITGDNCPPITGEVEFTVFQDQGDTFPRVSVTPPLGAMRLPLRNENPAKRVLGLTKRAS